RIPRPCPSFDLCFLFISKPQAPGTISARLHEIKSQEISTMRARSIGIRTLALLLLASLGFTLNSAAQNAEIAPGTERPMFTRFAGQLHSPRNAIEATATPLTTWNGSFVF